MKACDAIVSICTRYGKVHNIVYCYAYFLPSVTLQEAKDDLVDF